MVPARKALIGELFYQITKIVNCIRDPYYTKYAPDIGNTVKFPENAAPVIANYVPPQQAEELITQDVKWEYLTCPQNKVVIKARPPRTVGTTSKVNLDNYRQDGRINWSSALCAQNTIISNSAECGNCMYGALALEIFGEQRASCNIEYYAGILRNTAANYILANEEYHLPLMVQITDKPLPNETEDQMYARLQPEFKRRLIDYCAAVRNTLQWGTAAEMEAIAAVVGVPIHVYYSARPMTLGKNGIEDGVIQPNNVIGGRFTGAPIRLLYSGYHYNPIRLKT
jgi:hypothetical protein